MIYNVVQVYSPVFIVLIPIRTEKNDKHTELAISD